jgi:hypothetical protein
VERTVAGAGGGESILSGAREVEVLRARVGGAEGRTVAGIGGPLSQNVADVYNGNCQPT